MSWRARLAALLAAAALFAGCARDRPSGAETAVDTAALRPLVDSLLPELARLAALPQRGPVRIASRSAAEVRAYVAARLAEEMPPALIAQLHEVYSLLGLMPDTLDLQQLLLDLYSEQIVGYYDPRQHTMYVVGGVSPESVAPVLAHELVHALQDQHVNLDSLIARERGNDAQSAAHAAVEGHATVVMFAYLAERAEGRRLDPLVLPNPAPELAAGLRSQNDQYPVFRRAPAIIRETMLFPYIAGADFVYQLWQAQPRTRPAPFGRWLPHSTEQVLHPADRFLSTRDEPTGVPPPLAPDGWSGFGTPDQLGELETASFLAHYLGENARMAARGWDGDRYLLLRHPQHGRALGWNSAWDDAAAARRFAAAVRQIATRVRDRHIVVALAATASLPCVSVMITDVNKANAPADPLPGRGNPCRR